MNLTTRDYYRDRRIKIPICDITQIIDLGISTHGYKMVCIKTNKYCYVCEDDYKRIARKIMKL